MLLLSHALLAVLIMLCYEVLRSLAYDDLWQQKALLRFLHKGVKGSFNWLPRMPLILSWGIPLCHPLVSFCCAISI